MGPACHAAHFYRRFVIIRGISNPFSAAFGTTFAAILLIVPGLLGYELHKSNWSIMRVTVADGPVWWQIYLGLLFVLPAIYFWRKALRALP